MIEFMRSHYYDSVVAQYVHPKNDFKDQNLGKGKTPSFRRFRQWFEQVW